MASRSGELWGDNVAERYQSAVFVSRSKNGDWQLRLDRTLGGSNKVRVSHRNLDDRREP